MERLIHWIQAQTYRPIVLDNTYIHHFSISQIHPFTGIYSDEETVRVSKRLRGTVSAVVS